MKQSISKLIGLIFVFTSLFSFAQHNAGNSGKILMIVSNPAVSEQTGWPIGVWASEVTHPYWEFSEAGYTVEFASPEGGEVKFDGFSLPDDASGYSAFDYISRGFLADPSKMELLKNTIKISDVNPDNYKAIFVCGGQGPMYTFYNNEALHQFFGEFYATGKPTAAICHGTNILLKAKVPGTNRLIVDGKKWTGFASSEEQYADNYVGMQIQPFRIEEEAKKIENTTFVTAAPFSSFALADGNLITGQQQNSGAEAAKLTIEALEKDKKRYPTYVLVHGAWADESAWGFVRNQLAVNANVEVVNLPAHGVELTPAGEVTLQDYVNTVKSVIEKYDGKVKLVGHSMAGVVISQVAEQIPNKIEKLIYVSAYLPQNGEDLLSISKKDKESKVGEALEFTVDYSAATIKKNVIVPAVCADCPDYMKEALVKYHKAEPTKPLGEKVTLTAKKFGSVPKYYIHTTKDQAVGYDLQQAMAKANGKVKETYKLETSHLPFVVDPAGFLSILSEIN
ncbi:MAG: alpha/beta fold hydrolase [Cyclobacteriaceae bacterium]